MAKKTSVKRVHQLAKELGVSSKDIVSKCQAEGIPDITNHMSAISVGLSVTVREWFGGGAGESTAVETAAPVDVAAARKKAPKRAKAKAKAKPKVAAVDAGGTAPDVAPSATTDEVAAAASATATATAPTKPGIDEPGTADAVVAAEAPATGPGETVAEPALPGAFGAEAPLPRGRNRVRVDLVHGYILRNESGLPLYCHCVACCGVCACCGVVW